MPQMFDAVNLKEIAMDVKHADQPILTKKQELVSQWESADFG